MENPIPRKITIAEKSLDLGSHKNKIQKPPLYEIFEFQIKKLINLIRVDDSLTGAGLVIGRIFTSEIDGNARLLVDHASGIENTGLDVEIVLGNECLGEGEDVVGVVSLDPGRTLVQAHLERHTTCSVIVGDS